MRKIWRFVKKVGLALAYLYRRFHEEGYAYRVTALVYTTLHSLVPFSDCCFYTSFFRSCFSKARNTYSRCDFGKLYSYFNR